MSIMGVRRVDLLGATDFEARHEVHVVDHASSEDDARALVARECTKDWPAGAPWSVDIEIAHIPDEEEPR